MVAKTKRGLCSEMPTVAEQLYISGRIFHTYWQRPCWIWYCFICHWKPTCCVFRWKITSQRKLYTSIIYIITRNRFFCIKDANVVIYFTSICEQYSNVWSVKPYSHRPSALTLGRPTLIYNSTTHTEHQHWCLEWIPYPFSSVNASVSTTARCEWAI